ncbi:hypothetical protein C8R46DRAFT_1213576 [Mycena filopes]|nr:hypothetical protein C8R46DRAFT_1213576 [Mycena filopes]
MVLTLVERITIDAALHSSQFLVNTKYDRDFLPTRDRSIPAGCLYTFKTLSDDPSATEKHRGFLEAFRPNVFGHVDMVSTIGRSRVVRLRCPEVLAAHCRDMYAMQLKVLEKILDLDHESTGGVLGSSWLSLQSDVAFCAAAGSFYVVVPPSNDGDISVNTVVEMIVALKRVDRVADNGAVTHIYSLTALDFWQLRSVDLTHRGGCRWFGVEDRYLRSLRDYGYRALCCASYPAHFSPTRDRTLAGGSLFTYKDRIFDANLTLNPERRAESKRYTGVAFGEVRSVITLDQRAGFVVQICCPDDASCCAIEMYTAQIRLLKSVVDTDDVENPGDSSASWFVPPPPDNVAPRFADPCFYVYVMANNPRELRDLTAQMTTGKMLQVWVTPERIDRELPDGEVQKEYGLLAEEWRYFEPSDVPMQSFDYKCDRFSIGCAFYILEFADDDDPEALANCALHEHFAPTRDDGYQTPSATTRGSLELFTPIIFGEVAAVASCGPNTIVIKLIRPRISSCRVKRCYMKQYNMLRASLLDEAGNLQPVPDRTWINSDLCDTTPDIFVTLVFSKEWEMQEPLQVGQLAAMWVTMHRVVLDQSDDQGQMTGVMATPCLGPRFSHLTSLVSLDQLFMAWMPEAEWNPAYDAALDLPGAFTELGFPGTPASDAASDDLAVSWPGGLETDLSILAGVSYSADPYWARVLEDVSLFHLLLLGYRSDFLWRAIKDHIRANRVYASPRVECLERDGRAVGLSTIPDELAGNILSRLRLLDRIRFGQTSRRNRFLAGQALEDVMRDHLAVFGLCFADVRFMQTATMSTLAGKTLDWVMHGVPCELDAYDQDALTFYTPADTFHAVVSFFNERTAFNLPVSTDLHRRLMGVVGSVVLKNTRGQSVKVIRSATSSALDILPNMKYTPHVGAITHLGLWHGHPDATFTMTALPFAQNARWSARWESMLDAALSAVLAEAREDIQGEYDSDSDA